MNFNQISRNIIDSKLGKLAIQKLKNKQQVTSVYCENKKIGYYVDFFDVILEGYQILNCATKKGIKICN